MSAPMYDCHILEDNGSFKVWEKKVLHNVFPVTGLAGKACQTGKPTLKPFPCINDKLKDKFGNDTDIWLFDLEPYSGQGIVKQTLTAQGLREFKKAVAAYPSIVDAYEKNGNNQLTIFFNQFLSLDIRTTLQSDTDWINATNEPVTDNLAKWTILKKVFSQGTRKTKHRSFKEFLSLTQGTSSLPQFSQAVHDGFDTMAANFASIAHPNHIAMDDLKQLIFLTGLDPVTYRFFLDKWYCENPTGSLDTTDEIMANVAIYSREIRSEPSADQYAASYVTHTTESYQEVGPLGIRTVDGRTKCNGCGVPIPYLVSEHGIPRTKCPPCYRKYLTERKYAKASRSAKPGPVVPKLSQAGKTEARATIATVGTSSLVPGGSLRIHSASDDDSDDD